MPLAHGRPLPASCRVTRPPGTLGASVAHPAGHSGSFLRAQATQARASALVPPSGAPSPPPPSMPVGPLLRPVLLWCHEQWGATDLGVRALPACATAGREAGGGLKRARAHPQPTHEPTLPLDVVPEVRRG